MSAVKKCVLCGEASGKPVWREQDVDVVRCRGCGLVYTDLQETIAETFWKEPRPEKIDREDFYWDTARGGVYEEVLSLLTPGPEEAQGRRILDIGCGKAYFLHRAAARGFDAYGRELSPHAVRFAREKLGLVNVTQGRIEDAPFPKGFFHVITLWDVIEHLPDPGPVLSAAAGLLAEDGVLFVQTPNIAFHLPYAHAKRALAFLPRFRRSRKHLLEAKHHLVQFSRTTLAGMLGQSGFREIAFHVLSPIESVAGSRSHRLAMLKRIYTRGASTLFRATRGRVFLSNTLDAFASKGALPQRLRAR
jgi:2-polyprenyl-3-methyl-5-hydroxy-6-metoxy-1,4-benzoquinol methylase